MAKSVPKLRPVTVAQILAWACEHRRQTGRWPHQHSGPIPSDPRLQWHTVDAHLRRRTRGLPGGDSLSRLLARRLKARNLSGRPQLTEDGIVAWADAHRRRMGRWPTLRCGPVVGAPGETWKGIHQALLDGYPGAAWRLIPGAAPGRAPRQAPVMRLAPAHRGRRPGLGGPAPR
jgi:hypothetical protein